MSDTAAAPDREAQDRHDADMIADDQPMRAEPLEHRKEMRASLADTLDDAQLDELYGADSR